jgi:hypothetical protein
MLDIVDLRIHELAKPANWRVAGGRKPKTRSDF